MSFLKWFQVFSNWLSNLIQFIDAHYSISSNKENTAGPWCVVAIEIHKISTWVLLIELVRDKFLGNHLCDAFKHFHQTNKYNEIG